jgi:hypothetical protein
VATMGPAFDGMLVGGRYRLRERLGGQDESSMWGAVDEGLGRPVMVWIFPPGFRRTDAVAVAARAACCLDDPRLARVFDADVHGEVPYVVTEWPAGWPLGELLTAGPVEPVSAAAVVAEAAGALTVAHAAWLAHLCLRPCSLWWDTAGGVRVTGLGIAAAAAGVKCAEPVLADTRGLGRVLYAALTGYWPGAEQTPLPAAPRRGDRLYRPCQVRPGIPGELDAVACRALPEADCDAGPPIVDPAQLADELARAAGACSLRHALARAHLPGQPTAPSDRTQPLVVAPKAMTGPLKPTCAAVPSVTPEPPPAAVGSSLVAPAPGQWFRPPAGPSEPAGRAPGRQAPVDWPPGLRHNQVHETSGSPGPPAPRARGRARRAKVALAVMLMLAAVLLLAAGSWYLAYRGITVRGAGLGRNGGVNPVQRFAAPARASRRPLQPASAQASDPYWRRARRQQPVRAAGHRPQSGHGLAHHATARQPQARNGPAPERGPRCHHCARPDQTRQYSRRRLPAARRPQRSVTGRPVGARPGNRSNRVGKYPAQHARARSLRADLVHQAVAGPVRHLPGSMQFS